MTFADLGLSDQLLRAITDSGYDVPTPIQKGAIPSVLMGKDLKKVISAGSLKNPESLDEFVAMARKRIS